MSRKWKWVIIIILVLAVLLVADFVWNGKVSQFWHKVVTPTSSLSPSTALEGNVYQNYAAKVSVDVEKHRLSGSLQIQATNKTAVDQSAIYFHLYPNVFRELNKLRGENWDYVLGDKRIPGWIEIRNVSINHTQQQHFEVNDTILKIPLTDWKSGSTIQIAFDFELQVPKNKSRLSYDEHSIWLGNWLPIVAEYDENGWYLDPYHPIGDPFYSDVANYEIEIDVPVGYHVASSGNEYNQQVTVAGDRQQHMVIAQTVRDFALVIMDESYKNIRQTIGALNINTWYRASDKAKLAKELHQAGIASLSYFADAYGAYPYKEYDIVRTGGFFGGMEYPGIVFVQGQYFEEQDDYGIIVVAHETAHQWWYGIVGNNEVSDPWLDESLAQYSTLRFLLEHYGSIGRSMLRSSDRVVAASDRFEDKSEYVGSSVDQFSNWDSYGTLVYYKGLHMFYQLEQAIGMEKMNQILSDYVKHYQFQNTTDEGLIRIFEKHLGEQARTYFQAWLQGDQVEFVR